MLYDISPPITKNLAVWPGDTPPSREVLLDLAKGDPITLSTLHATVHVGAHADAPSHYGANANTIDLQPLDRYLGPCQLITANITPGARVSLVHLSVPITQPRVLIRTGTYPDPTVFTEGFAALEPALIHTLADSGVTLVGIDTPSVDLFDSKDLPAHCAALQRDIAILEGLVLTIVPDGVYELIALPLKLVGFDASPVRAVLRTMDG
jgi:arylformamidase